MVFSHPTFLFLFLPILLVGYTFSPRRLKNLLLLTGSLFFYAWGEPWLVAVMVGSIACNYGFSHGLQRCEQESSKRRVVIVAAVFNLGLLGAFKYLGFLVGSLNAVLVAAGASALHVPHIPLPIGISFFTFQALSYVVDVYRGEAEAQHNPIDFALYVSFFPQLIAGPIVRFRDVATQITSRRESFDSFSEGVERFILGLAKKVLIANAVAEVADPIFALPASDLSAGVAWLGALCYTIQIYFDFSGYSDMAIGLGLMFGFRYLENFSYPYVSTSLTDFWRRWHISLSTWLRDYLYIPLGGSRGSSARTYLNLVIVFFLCGLWHGASWTFVVWGLYHGAFLILERVGLARGLERLPRPLRHVYAMAVVIFGWVIFRATTLGQAMHFLLAMLGLGAGSGSEHTLGVYASNQLVFVCVVAVVAATPLLPWLKSRYAALCAGRAGREVLQGVLAQHRALTWGSGALLSCLFVACAMRLASNSYNPFIYFRF
jgi:alginate O-acetyltransferase complex protein AlgI